MSIADKIIALQNAKSSIATAITLKGGSVSAGAGFEAFPSAISAIPTSEDTQFSDLINGSISSVTGSYSKVANYCFYSNSTITTVNLPNCTTVGGGAFALNSQLSNVSLPACTTLGGMAFSSCLSLTSISLPECVSGGYYGAFASCSNLQSTYLPKLSILGYAMFANCKALTAYDFYSELNYDIGENAFYNTGLTTLNIPQCKHIGWSAFQYCYSLSEAYISGQGLQFDGNTFSNCGSLLNVDIRGLSALEYGAFYSCSSLTSVNIPDCITVANSVFYFYSPFISNQLSTSGEAHLTTSSADILLYASLTSATEYSSSLITGIADAVYYRSYLRYITSINCPNLTTVGWGAFSSCISLTYASFSALTYVGSYAFLSCRNMSGTIDLTNCAYIGDSAFTYCYSMNFVGIGAPDLEYIGYSVFSGVDSSRLSFYSDVISLPKCSYIGRLNNYSMTELYAPVCLSVGAYAMAWRESLLSVTLTSCLSIGYMGFYGCYSLAYISVPNLEYVGREAFMYCRQLSTISLPKCTSINNEAFYGCGVSSPTPAFSIYLGTSDCQLGWSDVFYNTLNLSIYVPSQYVDYYKSATNWVSYSSRIFGYTPE